MQLGLDLLLETALLLMIMLSLGEMILKAALWISLDALFLEKT